MTAPDWPRAVTAGPIGLAPYGDSPEANPEPVVVFSPDRYRPFWATDARSVMIVLTPNHYNYIPNPAIRVDDHGWLHTGFDSYELLPDSWVGQSIHVTGEGTLSYSMSSVGAPYDAAFTAEFGLTGSGDPARFVYVGPTRNPDQMEWAETGVGGGQYTFSIYAKGSGYLQLVMTAYAVVDPSIIESAMNPVPLAQAASPFLTVSDSDWTRFWVKTTALLTDVSDQVNNFAGAYWVDCQVVVTGPASDVQLSAFMLDSHEDTVAEYFDGSLDETGDVDDYLWLIDSDNSISVYYYDRIVRTRWLHTYLFTAVPAGMPVQMFFHDLDHAYIPSLNNTPGT